MIVIFFSEMLWNDMEYTFHFLVVTGEFFLECTWIKHSGSFYSKKLHSSCSLHQYSLYYTYGCIYWFITLHFFAMEHLIESFHWLVTNQKKLTFLIYKKKRGRKRVYATTCTFANATTPLTHTIKLFVVVSMLHSHNNKIILNHIVS